MCCEGEKGVMRSIATGIANKDNPPFVIELLARQDDWDLGREQHHGQRHRRTSKAVHMTAPPPANVPCRTKEPLAIRVPSTHDTAVGGAPEIKLRHDLDFGPFDSGPGFNHGSRDFPVAPPALGPHLSLRRWARGLQGFRRPSTQGRVLRTLYDGRRQS